jgi:hypothetical protein
MLIPFQELISFCPDKRPSAKKALHHPYFMVGCGSASDNVPLATGSRASPMETAPCFSVPGVGVRPTPPRTYRRFTIPDDFKAEYEAEGRSAPPSARRR